MIKYLLLFSLIAAGAGVATATRGTPNGGAGSCKLQCNNKYNAGIAHCSTFYGTGVSNVDFQNCAAQVVADYYACVSLCH